MVDKYTPESLDALMETADLQSLPPTSVPNKQLYVNNPLSQSDVAVQAAANPSGLYNAKDPNLAIQHEKPVHRLICLMKIQGATNREIAAATGYTEAWVSQIVRQPWMRQQMVTIIEEEGRDDIEALLKSTIRDSIYTLIDIRDDANAARSDRRQAADSLLDRVLGKPTQKIVSDNTTKLVSTDIAELDKQIAQLSAEESRLRGQALPVQDDNDTTDITTLNN